MAKPKLTPTIPADCCAVCKFSHNMEGALLCFGAPPVLAFNENGEPEAYRGAEVLPEDPPCHLFNPRLHS